MLIVSLWLAYLSGWLEQVHDLLHVDCHCTWMALHTGCSDAFGCT